MRLSLAALLLGGCTLIDQRTFSPTPPAPTATEIARAKAPVLPLVSIRMDQPGQNNRAVLADAVQAAQARKLDVTFDVFAMVPSQAPPAEQDRRAAEATNDARAIATELEAVGVMRDRLRLGLRGDPGTPPREVCIYVR